jgi:predicted component of type VI protein secretion system
MNWEVQPMVTTNIVELLARRANELDILKNYTELCVEHPDYGIDPKFVRSVSERITSIEQDIVDECQKIISVITC